MPGYVGEFAAIEREALEYGAGEPWVQEAFRAHLREERRLNPEASIRESLHQALNDVMWEVEAGHDMYRLEVEDRESLKVPQEDISGNWCPNGCQPLCGLPECGACGYVGWGVPADKTQYVLEPDESTGHYIRLPNPLLSADAESQWVTAIKQEWIANFEPGTDFIYRDAIGDHGMFESIQREVYAAVGYKSGNAQQQDEANLLNETVRQDVKEKLQQEYAACWEQNTQRARAGEEPYWTMEQAQEVVKDLAGAKAAYIALGAGDYSDSVVRRAALSGVDDFERIYTEHLQDCEQRMGKIEVEERNQSRGMTI